MNNIEDGMTYPFKFRDNDNNLCVGCYNMLTDDFTVWLAETPTISFRFIPDEVEGYYNRGLWTLIGEE